MGNLAGDEPAAVSHPNDLTLATVPDGDQDLILQKQAPEKVEESEGSTRSHGSTKGKSESGGRVEVKERGPWQQTGFIVSAVFNVLLLIAVIVLAVAHSESNEEIEALTL